MKRSRFSEWWGTVAPVAPRKPGHEIIGMPREQEAGPFSRSMIAAGKSPVSTARIRFLNSRSRTQAWGSGPWAQAHILIFTMLY